MEEDPKRNFPKEDMQMATRHTKKKKKKHTTLQSIREMQIKTTIRYHVIFVRMTVIKKMTNYNC